MDTEQQQRKGTAHIRQPGVADLVDALFRQKRHPTSGRRFSYVDVSRGVGGALQPSYIAKLHSGAIKNPGRDALLQLCIFFEVSPAYFFPELTTTASEERPVETLQRVLAAMHLTAHQQAVVEDIVFSFQSQVETSIQDKNQPPETMT